MPVIVGVQVARTAFLLDFSWAAAANRRPSIRIVVTQDFRDPFTIPLR
jgi:hypothetical protein